MSKLCVILSLFFGLVANAENGLNDSERLNWVKVSAASAIERSKVSDFGVAITYVTEDYVVGYANTAELSSLIESGMLEVTFPIEQSMLDFPEGDEAFHNYSELSAKLEALAHSSPIAHLEVIGKTLEERNLYALTISSDVERAANRPASIFLGGHHAREHLSIEMPIMLAEYLVEQYSQGNQRIKNLVDSRTIYIIPIVNPDGAEHDIHDGRYHLWRKNRKQNDNGSFGVDLNRNYGYNWGQGGASQRPSSDTYRGTEPFSELETQAVKRFVESRNNITTLLTFHSFSELILYPWGYTYDSIANSVDLQVHETMAQTMSVWNGYTPQQSSDLYITSGDTTDWSYGDLGIFSFTFELDPKWGWGGTGFYPGADTIDIAFGKNLEPCLYLIENSGNPYGVVDKKSAHPYSISL